MIYSILDIKFAIKIEANITSTMRDFINMTAIACSIFKYRFYKNNLTLQMDIVFVDSRRIDCKLVYNKE